MVTPLAELITTGSTEKAKVAAMLLSALALTLTEPVNLLNGVIVKVMPEATLPDRTLADPVQGVMEKSGWVEETTSIGATMPAEEEMSDPFDAAKVASPE